MKNNFLAKLSAVPEVEPDEIDCKMLAEIEEESDCAYVSLETIEKTRVYNGNISLRVPKDLHQHLVETAKDQGVSLNQYCLYKLAR